MWYRIAIDLSNLRPMNQVESAEPTSINETKLTDQPVHKAIEKFHFQRDQVDNILQTYGLDPDAPFLVNIADQLLEIIGKLIPDLEGVVEFIQTKGLIGWMNFILLRFTAGRWLIEDTKNLIAILNDVKNTQDPKERLAKFLKGMREKDGLFGLIANGVMIFNTIAKALKEIAGLKLANQWTFSAYFYGAPLAKYIMEMQGDKEDQSGLSFINTRVINPTNEYLLKSNPKNQEVINLVEKYIANNPTGAHYMHDEIEAKVLEYFKDRIKPKSRIRENLPQYDLRREDIVAIVDNLIENPWDETGPTKGMRLNSDSVKQFMNFLNNPSQFQAWFLRIYMALDNLYNFVSHVVVAENNSRVVVAKSYKIKIK